MIIKSRKSLIKTIEAKRASHTIFGGIDFYGIRPSQVELPQDIPKVGDPITIVYLEKKLKPLLEQQLKSHRFHKVRIVKFIGNKVYVVVDASDQDFEKTLVRRKHAVVPIRLSVENRKIFQQWQSAVQTMWRADKSHSSDSKQHIKIFQGEEKRIRKILAHNVRPIANIKDVLRFGGKGDLKQAAMLCHWTPKRDRQIAILLGELVLHQNIATRNNASRSLLINYPHLLPQIDIQRFFIQLHLPFHSDRNKALYVLWEYSKLPQYKKTLRQHLPEFKKLSRAVLPNIAQPAGWILKNLGSIK